jgi:hypothetical protein
VTTPIQILGPGADALTISGDANGDGNPGPGDSRIFNVVDEVSGSAVDPVLISGLRLEGGFDPTHGGAIYAGASRLTLDHVVIAGSRSEGEGGGVYTNNVALTITDSTITGNESRRSGGGLYTDDDSPPAGTASPLVIRDSTVSGNSAGDRGGGVYVDDTTDTALIDRTTISENVAGSTAGGLMLFGPEQAPGEVRDTTISGNVAGDDGGGVYVVDNSDIGERFEGSTVSSNIAGAKRPGFGGGIASDAFSGVISLESTIVADNAGPGGAPDDLLQEDPRRSNAFAAGFSLIEAPGRAGLTSAPDGSNLLGVDPRLDPLAANGGPTRTQLPTADSPALDAGISLGQETDQRHLPRTQEQPGSDRSGSDGTDIGAVEVADEAVDSPTAEARARKRGKPVVEVTAGAAEPVSLAASGSIAAGGKVRLRPTRATADAGARQELILKAARRRGARRVAARFAKRKSAKATVRVVLTDRAGNSVVKRLALRLRPGHPKRGS